MGRSIFNKVLRYLKLVMTIFKCSLMNSLEYRFNFFFGGIFELVWMGMYILMFDVIFLNTKSLAGWSEYEVYLLIALTGLCDATITFFFNEGLSSIPTTVNDGTLDFVLLKPINKTFLLSLKKFYFPEIYNIVICIALVFYLFSKLSVKLTVWKVILFWMLVINGVFIIYNLVFMLMSLSFWFIRMEVVYALTPQFDTVGNKPLSIYPRIMQKILIYLIPIFVCYNYPVMFLLNKLQVIDIIFAFSISALFFVLAQFVFKTGLKKYSSAGS